MDVAQEPHKSPPSGVVADLIPHVYRQLIDRGPQTAEAMADVFEVPEARVAKALEELRRRGTVRRICRGRPPAGKPSIFRVVEPAAPLTPENPLRPPPIPAVRVTEWESMTAALDDLEQAGVIPTSDVGWGQKMATIRAAIAELLESREAEIDLIRQVAELVRERDEARAMARAK